MSTKQVWNKTIAEMTFEELVDYIVGKIIFGIAKGKTLHSIVYECMQAVAMTYGPIGKRE